MKLRYLIWLALFTACSMPTFARAGTITVTGTLADAAAIHCYMEDAILATCSESYSYGGATSIADVLAGHLGESITSNSPGYVNGFAQILMGLSLTDMTDQDFLEVDMSLDGTFSNGAGATASLYADTGDSFSTWQISCGSYYVQHYGVPCNADGVQRILIPLANVDTLGLTLLLQDGLASTPGFADFLNSADYTIRLPTGTTLINNPGGTLFETEPTSSVPEPASILLLGTGVVAVARRFRDSRSRV